MALISCPECSKEISEFAWSCPNCGYPINRSSYTKSESSNNIEIPISEPLIGGLKTKSKLSKKTLLSIAIAGISILAIAIAVIIITNITSERADTIHNTKSGIDIFIGMEKERIDKICGEPSANSDDIYNYLDYGLIIKYHKGKAVMIMVTNGEWESIGGIKITDHISKITSQFGVSDRSYMFDKNSKITNDDEEVSVFIVYDMNKDTVESYTLYIGTKNKSLS